MYVEMDENFREIFTRLWIVKSQRCVCHHLTQQPNVAFLNMQPLLGLTWASIFGAHKILKLLLFNADRKGRSLCNVFGRVNRMTRNHAHAAAFAKHTESNNQWRAVYLHHRCVWRVCVCTEKIAAVILCNNTNIKFAQNLQHSTDAVII